MTQNSYPKVEAPFSDHQWKQLFLTLGRGIIDKGGFPYKLTARDSVTNEVTIGVDSRHGENFAVLDGFLHHMDAPEYIPVPPVTVDTTYEIGLRYDPAQHGATGGPVTLTAWTAPADTSGGKSYLVLYRMTRQNSVALGSTPYTEERPRAVPVFSVSSESSLPTNSLVLVDSLGIVRTTGQLHRAEISEAGTITWPKIGGTVDSGFTNTKSEIDAAVDKVQASTWDKTGSTLMWRGWDGVARVAANTDHVDNILNRGAGDARYAYKSHNHDGSAITSGVVSHSRISGSLDAYQNTNTGSTWASVVARDNGQFARYPSALKYKKNVRRWNLDPETVLGITPVKYEDRENGDTRVGVVADSYVDTLPELVETNPATGEVEGWKYMLMGVAQQVAIRHLSDQVKALTARIEALEGGN